MNEIHQRNRSAYSDTLGISFFLWRTLSPYAHCWAWELTEKAWVSLHFISLLPTAAGIYSLPDLLFISWKKKEKERKERREKGKKKMLLELPSETSFSIPLSGRLRNYKREITLKDTSQPLNKQISFHKRNQDTERHSKLSMADVIMKLIISYGN